MNTHAFDPNRATDNRTRVLISFAMAQGEAVFAMWLRNEIMRALGLAHERSVYLDSVTSRSGDKVIYKKPKSEHTPVSEKITNFTKEKFLGYGSVQLDEREHVQLNLKTGTDKQLIMQPIGAQNPQWNQMYLNAMKEADVMLFIYSTNWQNSKYCLQEYSQFVTEASRREASRPLKAIILNLNTDATRSDTFNPKPANLPKEHRASIISATPLTLSGVTLNAGAREELIRKIKLHVR